MNKNYSVGELAQRSGLTVRALHHYEKLGLLLPSARSEAGYRLYSEADVLRLHRLLAWRQTGMALKDIGPLLDRESPALREVLARQVAALQAQMLQQQQLLDALQHVARQAEGQGAGAGADDEPSLIEHLLFAMSMMRVQDKYFSAEDRLVLAQQKAQMGPERVLAAEAEWPALIRSVQQEMARGTPSGSPRVRTLAQRWMALTQQFVGDSPTLRSKVTTMYAQEPDLQRLTGVTPELIGYLRQAVAASGDAAAAGEAQA
jgi:DNA-binding transcriptional MerR regulator